MMIRVNGEYRWLRNLMDEKTRFLLVSEPTKSERSKTLGKFSGKQESELKGPGIIKTDRLPTYIDAYYKEFRTLKNQEPHVRPIRFEDGADNINLIEKASRNHKRA